MDTELDAEERAWLDDHLAGCASCARIAAEYTADRLALRALRAAASEPPRDLWARTAAAIEQESGSHRSSAGRGSRRASRIPLGALSSIAVIAVVIGVSTLSSDIITPQQAARPDETIDQESTTGGDGGSGPGVAQATPFAVGAGAVRWVDKTANGTLAYNDAAVDEVCPAEGTSGCPALKQPTQQRLSIDSEPRTIIGSPTDGQAVVIADDGSGGDQLLLVDLPEATSSPAAVSTSPVPTPAASEPPASEPPVSEPPQTGSAPLSSAAASATPPPSADVSPSPAASAGSDTSGPTPSLTPILPTPTPSLSPSPSVAASLAIASDIELVGESAAFSAGGSWFAFTARPADGSRGPDVYVWRVGDESARPLTTDGSTVFASWDGEEIVASRPDADTTAEGAVLPVTVRIDPATAEESPAGDLWRPVVDPTRRRALAWTGSIARSADGADWSPAVGRLELRAWTPHGARHLGDGQGRDALVVTDAATAGFDARWDESGEWVAVWVADAADPDVGRLSLYHVSAGRGELELPPDAPTGVPALPGFSIGEGRLAWATPPGQDGEGSRIQIVAWNDDGVGTVESAPGEDLVVVR
jgi:hypothetical protein